MNQIATAIPADNPIMHMIERVARDPAFPLERLEKLLELRQQEALRIAETEWNNAMAAAQAEIPTIGYDSNNPQTRSRYASYAGMDAIVRPIYTKHGFVLTFGTDAAQRPDDLLVTCVVARGGYARHYSIPMPADGKGARGSDVMTRTHATGSATTYGRRYLLSLIFNIASAEVDDDGNLAGKVHRQPPVPAPNAMRPQTYMDDIDNAMVPAPKPHQPSVDEIIIMDNMLAETALEGTDALKAAWVALPHSAQAHLESALRKRHKPAAEAADLRASGAPHSEPEAATSHADTQNPV